MRYFCALLIGFITLTGTLTAYAGSDGRVVSRTYYTEFIIDCEDSGIENTDTTDTIMINMVSLNNTNEYITPLNVGLGTYNLLYPNCQNGEAIYNFKSPYAGHGITVTNVIVTSHGTNALWIDEAILRHRHVTVTEYPHKYGDINFGESFERTTETLEILGHWGRDGGKGWCLSNDASDARGDWSSRTDMRPGCVRSFRFQVEGNAAYVSY